MGRGPQFNKKRPGIDSAALPFWHLFGRFAAKAGVFSLFSKIFSDKPKVPETGAVKDSM
jgi:hypothetical protein